MNPGELRNRITFQKQSDEKDDYGQPIYWEDVITVWASVNPIVGREFFAAETVNSEVTHKIRMRYRQGITPDMRICFKGRLFNIVSVINYQELNVELQLMCKELI